MTSLTSKIKTLSILSQNSLKIEINLFHIMIRVCLEYFFRDCRLRIKSVLYVFSRPKWNVKIQRRNECIMLFKRKWCKLLAI